VLFHRDVKGYAYLCQIFTCIENDALTVAKNALAYEIVVVSVLKSLMPTVKRTHSNYFTPGFVPRNSSRRVTELF
jgi:hypothetical protein